jgi:hypothetical protein
MQGAFDNRFLPKEITLLQKTQNGAPYFWRKVGMEKNIQDIGHD